MSSFYHIFALCASLLCGIAITNVTLVSDSIQYVGQQNDYSFTANLDGTHRFEFSNVPDGTDLRLIIYNSGWEELKSAYDLDTGDGFTYLLEKGKLYYIRVQQYENLGAYILNVGAKKPLIDISDFTAISDSVQYVGQQNDYSFTAKQSGIHRFEFSDVPDGTDLRLFIYNSGWEELKSEYDLDNSDGITYGLEAGKSYHLRVQQYENLGYIHLILELKNQLLTFQILQQYPIVYSTQTSKMIICLLLIQTDFVKLAFQMSKIQ